MTSRDEQRQAVLGQLATHADVRWHTSPQQYADAVLELADRLRRQADNTPPPRPAPGNDRHRRRVLAEAAAVLADKKRTRETVNPNGEQA